ncbi:MAG: LodA/GoxA family CTQ-dependent oxidase [Acidobacteriota bacterium]
MSHTEKITRFVVHPALGIARVGNADAYFYAPEVPGQPPDPSVPCGDEGRRFKDDAGRIKRQAARFRVYGLAEDGSVVTEITPDIGTVTWSVHLANRKAAWYEFVNPMDLDQRAVAPDNRLALAVTQRNTPTYGPGPTREQLTIDAGIATISGVDQAGPDLDDGRFFDTRVNLGQLRTDPAGRLVVLGGRGLAATHPPFNPMTHFANNDGWYDDISDGPVRASVVLDGSETKHIAESAMVAVVPPNYAPGLYEPTTMYDVVLDLYYNKKDGLKRPERPSFREHIWPIFRTLTSTEWVSQGFFTLFGAGAPYQFDRPEVYRRLASPRPEDRPFRERLFRWFRNPAGRDFEPAEIPPLYGDALRDFNAEPNSDLSVTPTQYHWLRQWADGDFVDDGGDAPPVRALATPHHADDPLADLPLDERPFALDRAALEEILGGPFRPGVELTWTLRVDQMWKPPRHDKSAPFRLEIVDHDDEVRDDYGPVLTPSAALRKGGPVHESGPGTLTRWMGVPWQADGASCLGGFDTSTFLPLPSLWPARAPNQVLSRDAYQRARDTDLRLPQRLKHMSYRQFWLRDLNNTDTLKRLNDMATEWSKVGIIASRPAPDGLEAFGYAGGVFVETERDAKFTEGDPTYEQVLIAENVIEPPSVCQADPEAQAHRDEAVAERNNLRDSNAPRRRTYGRLDL